MQIILTTEEIMKNLKKFIGLAVLGIALCLGLFVTNSDAQYRRHRGLSVNISFGRPYRFIEPRYRRVYRPAYVYVPQPTYYYDPGYSYYRGRRHYCRRRAVIY